MKVGLRKTCKAVAAGLVLALMPAAALAHDNLGGDELAAANWMLIGAIITIVIGLIWGVWALRAGQFSNVEESKYRMLELAEDYDAIMLEADAREEAHRQAEAEARQGNSVKSSARKQAGEALAGTKAH